MLLTIFVIVLLFLGLMAYLKLCLVFIEDLNKKHFWDDYDSFEKFLAITVNTILIPYAIIDALFTGSYHVYVIEPKNRRRY